MDPTWFQQPTDVLAKLEARSAAKGIVDNPRCGPALEAVEQYVELGGRFVWGDLPPELIAKTLGRGMPLLTGTSGTDLYRGAIFLGVGTDDGNLLVLRSKNWRKSSTRKKPSTRKKAGRKR